MKHRCTAIQPIAHIIALCPCDVLLVLYFCIGNLSSGWIDVCYMKHQIDHRRGQTVREKALRSDIHATYPGTCSRGTKIATQKRSRVGPSRVCTTYPGERAIFLPGDSQRIVFGIFVFTTIPETFLTTDMMKPYFDGHECIMIHNSGQRNEEND